MSFAATLSVIKYLGFALTALASIWSLTQTTTTNNPESGKKQLTPEGRWAITIALMSAILSMLSFGFESLVKEQEKRADEQKAQFDQERKQAEGRRQDEARRADAAERRADAAGLKADAATLKAAAATQKSLTVASAAQQAAAASEQKFLTLSLATDQSKRDADLARELNTATQISLKKAEDALTQIERLNFPIGKFELAIVWEVNPEGQNELANSLSNIIRQQCHSEFQEVNYEITSESAEALYNYFLFSRALIAVYSRDRNARLLKTWHPQVNAGDLNFTLTTNASHHIKIECASKKAYYVTSVSSDMSIARSGSIIAVPDLKGSVIIMCPNSDVAMQGGILVAGGQTYRLRQRNIERLPNLVKCFRTFDLTSDRLTFDKNYAGLYTNALEEEAFDWLNTYSQ